MFAATENKGFQISFSNGYTISCQFGARNYCSHYGRHLEPDYELLEEMHKRIHKSVDCEVAIWKNGSRWVTREIIEAVGIDHDCGDDVLANATPDEVAKIIAHIVNLDTRETHHEEPKNTTSPSQFATFEYYLLDVKRTVKVNGVDVAFDYINIYYNSIEAIKEAMVLSMDTKVVCVSVHRWFMDEKGKHTHGDDLSPKEYNNVLYHYEKERRV